MAFTAFWCLVWQIVGNGYQNPKTESDPLENSERWEGSQTNEHQNHGEYGSQWDHTNVSNSMNDVDKAALDMVSVHRHFHSLERQQLSMMEMLQVNIQPPEFLLFSLLMQD